MESHLDHAFAVILAGGSGTRLWPLSRDGQPKQFLKLGGEATLLQQAAKRISKLIPWERILVVTNQEYAQEVQNELPSIPARNIIAEPMKRDTALAMAVGSLIAKKRDPKAVVTNIASDHVITDENEYQRVIKQAISLASDGQYLVTVGIMPTSPDVNFGYIKAGSQLADSNEIRTVSGFKEKPNLETAQKFLAEGDYFWNANMYTWHVNAVEQAFKEHLSTAIPGLTQIEAAIDTDKFESTLLQVYEQSEKISIDVAISEKANNLLLIPGDFGWDDVGLWSTVYQLGAKDKDQTVVVQDLDDKAPVLSIQSQRNLVSTNQRLVALVGVEDLVVVDSDDVLMIVPRDKSAEVKTLVQTLKDHQLEEYL